MNVVEETPVALRRDTSRPAAAPAEAADLPVGGEFLTLRLGEEEYAIDIQRVQEIRSYEPPTRVAHAPSFIRGVRNLRGVIVPIVDLRLKLGCAEARFDTATVVIVLNIAGRVVGVIVDSVSDVLQLGAGNIRPAPEMARGMVDTSYITGIGMPGGDSGERMLILVDIVALMTSPDMGLFDAPASA